MVSFCDVPILKNDEHSERYGKYTIAISKEYLYNKYPNCAPVRYIRSDDPIFSAKSAQSIKEAAIKQNIKLYQKANTKIVNDISSGVPVMIQCGNKLVSTMSFDKFSQIIENENQILSAEETYYRSLGYAKRISEEREREGKVILQSNYDECEWRIITIPNEFIRHLQTPKWLTSDQYYKWRGNKINPKPFLNIPSVSFSVSDLAYILIDIDSELPTVIKDIMNLKTLCDKPITIDDKEILCSKVITRESLFKYM